jgi:hypothetical protein
MRAAARFVARRSSSIALNVRIDRFLPVGYLAARERIEFPVLFE